MVWGAIALGSFAVFGVHCTGQSLKLQDLIRRIGLKAAGRNGLPMREDGTSLHSQYHPSNLETSSFFDGRRIYPQNIWRLPRHAPAWCTRMTGLQYVKLRSIHGGAGGLLMRLPFLQSTRSD